MIFINSFIYLILCTFLIIDIGVADEVEIIKNINGKTFPIIKKTENEITSFYFKEDPEKILFDFKINNNDHIGNLYFLYPFEVIKYDQVEFSLFTSYNLRGDDLMQFVLQLKEEFNIYEIMTLDTSKKDVYKTIKSINIIQEEIQNISNYITDKKLLKNLKDCRVNGSSIAEHPFQMRLYYPLIYGSSFYGKYGFHPKNLDLSVYEKIISKMRNFQLDDFFLKEDYREKFSGKIYFYYYDQYDQTGKTLSEFFLWLYINYQCDFVVTFEELMGTLKDLDIKEYDKLISYIHKLRIYSNLVLDY